MDFVWCNIIYYIRTSLLYFERAYDTLIQHTQLVESPLILLKFFSIYSCMGLLFILTALWTDRFFLYFSFIAEVVSSIAHTSTKFTEYTLTNS